MKNFLRLFLVMLVSSLILLVSVYSQIKVSYVGGEVYFTRDNLRQRVTFGMEVTPGDIITTSKRSFVALVFDDGSVHKVTANSQYQIKEYRNTADSRFQIFNIVKGKIFSFVSKTFKRSDIKFLTPTAVVGVRGTSFVTEVDDNGGTTVFLINGEVGVSMSSGSGPSTSLKQGEKARVSGGKINKEVMQEEDYKQAAKDVPVSLAEVQVLQEEASDEAGEQQEKEKKQEKQLARKYVDESLGRINEQREEIFQNRVWNRSTTKDVGDYRITQTVKRPQDNQISIINHTYNKSKKRQSALDLSITFEKSIPGMAEVNNKTSIDVEQIDWKMTVSKGGKKDELFYSENFAGGSREVTFNEQTGESIEGSGYIVAGSNIPIPRKIDFKINEEDYSFILDYKYVNSDNKEISSIVLDKDSNTYDGVLGGDLDTRIQVRARLPKGAAANVLEKGKENKFFIIILNDFLVPLFNNVAS